MKNGYLKVLGELEKQNYRLRCYYNTCIKLLDYELSEKNNINRKTIYIYGCGEIGKRYYKIIKNLANVIAFIDKSAKENEYEFEGIKVMTLDNIDNSVDFDYIVITLEDLYQVISDQLVRVGIDKHKIRSIDEIIC